MQGKIKLGLVGGNFARSFLFNAHPDGEVVAVADLRADRRDALRAHFQCDTAYDSLEQLLRDPKVKLPTL